MAIAVLRSLLAARNVSEAIRAVRTSGTSDREQKDLVNEYFALSRYEQKEGISRADLAKRMYNITLTAGETRPLDRYQDRRLDEMLNSRNQKIVQQARLEVHERLFGKQRLSRLAG